MKTNLKEWLAALLIAAAVCVVIIIGSIFFGDDSIRPQNKRRYGAYKIYTVEYSGHDYVVWSMLFKAGFCHSASCRACEEVTDED